MVRLMFMNRFRALRNLVILKLSSLGSLLATKAHSIVDFLTLVILPRCLQAWQAICNFLLMQKTPLPNFLLIFGAILIIVLLNFSLRLALLTLINAWVWAFMHP